MRWPCSPGLLHMTAQCSLAANVAQTSRGMAQAACHQMPDLLVPSLACPVISLTLHITKMLDLMDSCLDHEGQHDHFTQNSSQCRLQSTRGHSSAPPILRPSTLAPADNLKTPWGSFVFGL